MTALVAVTHAFLGRINKNVDARAKPAQDDWGRAAAS
jgi:hypothetical protein